jgi:hypothetical protein
MRFLKGMWRYLINHIAEERWMTAIIVHAIMTAIPLPMLFGHISVFTNQEAY